MKLFNSYFNFGIRLTGHGTNPKKILTSVKIFNIITCKVTAKNFGLIHFLRKKILLKKFSSRLGKQNNTFLEWFLTTL